MILLVFKFTLRFLHYFTQWKPQVLAPRNFFLERWEEENKKARKQENTPFDQESNQEKKKENTLSTKKATKKRRRNTFLFSWSFSWPRACFLPFFLNFFFSLISHIRKGKSWKYYLLRLIVGLNNLVSPLKCASCTYSY